MLQIVLDALATAPDAGGMTLHEVIAAMVAKEPWRTADERLSREVKALLISAVRAGLAHYVAPHYTSAAHGELHEYPLPPKRFAASVEQ